MAMNPPPPPQISHPEGDYLYPYEHAFSAHTMRDTAQNKQIIAQVALRTQNQRVLGQKVTKSPQRPCATKESTETR